MGAAIKDVQPIRSLDGIEDMKYWLKRQNERDYMMFLLGINWGLRVSDLIELEVKTVKKKRYFIIKEGKTNKPRKVLVNGLYDELNAYIASLDGPWLFPSRNTNGGNGGHITRIQAYRILNQAAEMADMPFIGTHSLRKTFGYWFYKQHKDIAALQEILNHSKPEVTKRYIGITAEEIENKLNDFQL